MRAKNYPSSISLQSIKYHVNPVLRTDFPQSITACLLDSKSSFQPRYRGCASQQRSFWQFSHLEDNPSPKAATGPTGQSTTLQLPATLVQRTATAAALAMYVSTIHTASNKATLEIACTAGAARTRLGLALHVRTNVLKVCLS